MSPKGTILLVEDDMRVQINNKEILERHGYGVVLATDLSGARSALADHRPDAVVLDIVLPDGDGVVFLREIRRDLQIPVLMLTSTQAPERAADSFDAGGDDYMRKPYDLREFRARVDALMRRASKLPERVVRGPLTLDLAAGRAYLDGRDIGLKPKEFALLAMLVRNEARDVPAGELYEAVWKMPAAGDIRTVKSHISKLRAKLSAGGDGQDEKIGITSSYRDGYRFYVRES